MAANPLQQAWAKYCARKTRKGIVSDFVFLAIVVTLLWPTAREGLQVYAIRASMFQPKPMREVAFLDSADWTAQLTDANGRPVCIGQPLGRPMLISIGATWCVQSRAELASQQRLINAYADSIEVVMVTDEEPAEALAYMTRHSYGHRLLFCPDESEPMRGVKSIPTTLLVAPNGRILIRKVGAAKWNGSVVRRTIDSLLHDRQ